MRLFHYVKIAQAVCCFLMLCLIFSTTELRGRLFKSDENKELLRLLKDRGGPCEQLLLYFPSRPITHHHQQQRQLEKKVSAATEQPNAVDNSSSSDKDGPSKLTSDDDNNNIGQDADSGRIVAVFQGSSVKTDGNTNTTDELRLRAFLLFEWTSASSRTLNDSSLSLEPSHTAGHIDEGSPRSADESRQVDNGTEQGRAGSGGEGLRLPKGEYAFKVSKRDGLKRGSTDPFDVFARFLFMMAVVVLLQLIYIIAHLVLKANDENNKKRRSSNIQIGYGGSYSTCELLCLIFGMSFWVALLFIAAEMGIKRDSHWLCTNFRPELPCVFPWTSFFSGVLVFLFCVEMCMCMVEADDEGNKRARQHARHRRQRVADATSADQQQQADEFTRDRTDL